MPYNFPTGSLAGKVLEAKFTLMLTSSLRLETKLYVDVSMLDDDQESLKKWVQDFDNVIRDWNNAHYQQVRGEVSHRPAYIKMENDLHLLHEECVDRGFVHRAELVRKPNEFIDIMAKKGKKLFDREWQTLSTMDKMKK